VIPLVQAVVLVELSLVQPPLLGVDDAGELNQVVLCIALVNLQSKL
jgi:hypothetical protein